MTASKTSNWSRVKFGDVVRNVNATTKDPSSIGLDRVVGLDHMDPESLPLKRWDELSDLNEGTSFTRIFRSGQVLFGKRRAYQKKVSLPDFDGICSGDILVFEPSSDLLLPDFLPYIVQSDGFFEHALGTSAGSLSPRTKWQELAKYEFVLPSVEEQKGIVELMVCFDDYLEALKEIPSEQIADSLLESMTMSPENDRATITLGQLLEQVQRPVKVAELQEIPFGGVRLYAQGVYLRERAESSSVKTSKLNRIEKNDIVYNRMWATKAAFGVVEEEAAGCLVTNDFPTFIPRGQVSPQVFKRLFESKYFQREAARLAKGTTERRRLKEKDFLSIEVRLPDESTLERIMEQFVLLENLVAHAADSSTSVLALRQILLNTVLGETSDV